MHDIFKAFSEVKNAFLRYMQGKESLLYCKSDRSVFEKCHRDQGEQGGLECSRLFCYADSNTG